MEVKGAERLSYANEGFDEMPKEKILNEKRRAVSQHSLPTAAGLFVGQRANCIFCDKTHDSQICVYAQTMLYGLKKRKILEKKACLSCLKLGHMSKAYKTYVKCMVCQKSHVTLMCPDLDINKKAVEDVRSNRNEDEQAQFTQSNLNCTDEVMLQTLQCIVRNGNKQKRVRVLLDSGFQKSYIFEKTARELAAKSKGEVKLCHLLFGGLKEVRQHKLCEVQIEGADNKVCSFLKLLGHERMCGGISTISRGPWMAELKGKGISVCVFGEATNEIEVLIGSDCYATWLTGRKHCLDDGLVALETCFGWTISGKLNMDLPENPEPNIAMQVTSMFVAEANVADLWNQETIGIKDLAKSKS